MNPGLLNQRLTLFYPVSSSVDRYGQSKLAYGSGSYWCSYKPESGGGSMAGDLVRTTATYTFVMRENANVSEKAYIDFKGNTYNITFLDASKKGVLRIVAERRN